MAKGTATEFRKRVGSNGSTVILQARDSALEQGTVLVTTDYVVDETLTLIRRRLGLRAAETRWQQIESSSRLRWEWIGLPRTERARSLFFRHRDKDFSFTDCTGFVVMREMRIRQVLTTDTHFSQMGFDVQPG